MAENKTKPTSVTPDVYIASVANQKRREDAENLLAIMCQATGAEPVMWGPSIVGFGSYHYKYASGREGDSCAVGFSARAAALTVYGIVFYDEGRELLEQLGPVESGKGCVYIKDLSKIDTKVLAQMVTQAFRQKTARFSTHNCRVAFVGCPL